MAGKGGRTSGTWPKGKNIPGGKRHKKTIVKESLGLTGWNAFKDYVEKEGADKLQREISKLTGKNFVTAYSALAEFVKPKLARTTIAGDAENPIIFPIMNVDPLRDDKADNSTP